MNEESRRRNERLLVWTALFLLATLVPLNLSCASAGHSVLREDDRVFFIDGGELKGSGDTVATLTELDGWIVVSPGTFSRLTEAAVVADAEDDE